MEDDLPCPELLVGRDGGKLLYLVSRQVLEQLSVLQVPDEAGIFLHCSSAYNIVARALAEFLGQYAVFDGHAAVSAPLIDAGLLGVHALPEQVRGTRDHVARQRSGQEE